MAWRSSRVVTAKLAASFGFSRFLKSTRTCSKSSSIEDGILTKIRDIEQMAK